MEIKMRPLNISQGFAQLFVAWKRILKRTFHFDLYVWPDTLLQIVHALLQLIENWFL